MKWIIESSDGRVLRVSDAGIVLSGSDPAKYTDEKLARRVADEVVGLVSAHGLAWKLNVVKEGAR